MFHGVKITDGAIIAAATLSNRYITDRFLPDKAIDLVDEACAMIRTEIDSMPTELDVIRRKIIQHEIEEAALKKETDKLSQGIWQTFRRNCLRCGTSSTPKRPSGRMRRTPLGRYRSCAPTWREANAQLEKSQREYDLNRAAELQVRTDPRAEEAAGGGGADRQRGQGPLSAPGQGHRGGRSPGSSSAGPASRWPV